ncbi:hypothetical protein ERIC2_c07230 [Paenibacillus larvae subsp. larvae DSM 25430]|uniref:RmlD-like substrate binding domain-containing protein n=2 Tax=Paenibacillus larvae TaxID=1464 RepID=V9W602_9BACL|nr:hypothetical protein ERIC2_c07230 [Paenibacillus larvae subsp. larvae DSM 25430]
MQAVSETIAGARPDIVIHAAAYTQVDQAERDPETTYMINSLAPVVSHLPQRRRMRGWSLSARTMFSTGKKKASMPNRTVRIRSAYTAAPSCTERNSSR